MADDAAAPEGKLTGDALTPEDATEGATESPQQSEQNIMAVDAADGVKDPEAEDPEVSVDDEVALLPPVRESMSPVTLAMIFGVVVVLALGVAVGWLAFRSVESRNAAEQREVFLQVGRQAAINLTTIDAATVDADVQRILDSAADSFYDDFSARTQPFVDVVRQAQSKSVGEVTSAGLEPESITADGAQVLVAITVETSNVGAPQQEPRAWRMRIAVKQVADEVKVTNVEFVP